MSLSRRQLLKLAVLGVAGHTLDLDRLLWVPGKKTIFIPHPKQVEFYNQLESSILYGVPYHMFNCTSGQWLGILRKGLEYSELRPDNETSKVSKQQS